MQLDDCGHIDPEAQRREHHPSQQTGVIRDQTPRLHTPQLTALPMKPTAFCIREAKSSPTPRGSGGKAPACRPPSAICQSVAQR